MARLKEKKYPNLAVKKIKKMLKLSDRKLSFGCGLNHVTISNYLRGKHTPYHHCAEALAKYCQKMGIDIEPSQFYHPFTGIEKLNMRV